MLRLLLGYIRDCSNNLFIKKQLYSTFGANSFAKHGTQFQLKYGLFPSNNTQVFVWNNLLF